MPVRGAGNEHFHEGIPPVFRLKAQCLFNGFFRGEDVLDVVRGNPFDVIRRVEGGEQFAYADGIAVDGGIPAVLAGSRLLPDEGRGRHLSARHAVNAVVDENDGDVFAARRRMDGFRHADGREVAVPLVDEHQPVGKASFDARRDGGSPAVGGFLHIAVEIIVGEHRAPDGGDADRLIFETEFLYALRDQPVHDAVRTAGAVMQRGVREHFRLFEYLCHVFLLTCPRAPC